MAYCSAADVQAHFPHLVFNAESQPTLNQVTGFIDEGQDNVIDPQVQSVVTLPVTDEKGLNLLKQLNIWYAAAEVGRATGVDEEKTANYQKMFDDGLKRILANPQMIQPTTQGYGPRSHTPKAPTFVRGERQW